MRLAVVTPRYGPGAVGGAENQSRGFAEEAARHGHAVEVWTTCARDHFTWTNDHPPGAETLDGVTVIRFPITHFDPEQRAAFESRLVATGSLPPPDQLAWLRVGPHSAPLYAHIARHAPAYDALILLPYANPLTHYAAWAAPRPAVLWPCLHDEPYAYLEPVRLLLEEVGGVMFNSPEESQLATHWVRIRPRRHAVLGEGVSLAGRSESAAATAEPYLIYVGRLEAGKNLALLYDYLRRLWDDSGRRLRLVVVGQGPLLPPAHPAFDFRGYVDDAAKAALCAGALALCQPSLNESFSLTIMESWLAGRPVLVHAGCPVTSGHTRRSQGGLWFDSYDTFSAVVEWLLAHPDQAARLGANGRTYVQRNYTWPAVVARFGRILQSWRWPALHP